MRVREGAASITLGEGVFFNPAMELCRDVCSLAVGTLEGRLELLDGLCATGVRGIRYALENDNVQSVHFVDTSVQAIALARKNARANNLKRASFAVSDFNRFIFSRSFDFVELDPFGSPIPFLYHALRSFRTRKTGFLSVTATDTAVLCGAEFAACIKHYGARPLHNELCHEAGARILLGKIARTASEFNLGITPLFTLSRQHFIKVLVRLEQGAEAAVDSAKSALGFFFYCPKCLHYESARRPLAPACPACNNPTREWSGPLWIGELHDRQTLERMRELNRQRDYARRREIDALLSLMLGEVGFPPGFVDLHVLGKVRKEGPKKIADYIRAMEAEGWRAARTHFRSTGVKLAKPDVR
ncbi:MAG: methyltransferase domain-containing protein [Candidatus Micrarchaeia archaeon]